MPPPTTAGPKDHLTQYEVQNAQALSTPSIVDLYRDDRSEYYSRNCGGEISNASRWRPHLKTAKLGFTMRRLVARGIKVAKCATTLELVAAIDAGMEDVVVAFPLMGPNAKRLKQIAAANPGTADLDPS